MVNVVSDLSQEVDELVRECIELRHSGQLDEAIQVAKRAISIAPESANAWWQLALSSADEQGDAAALDYFRKTVELADSFAYGWDRLGDAYESMSMQDEAIEAWETACLYDAESDWPRYSLVHAYWARKKAGDDDRMFEHLSELENQGKLRQFEHYLLGNTLHERGEHHSAIPHFKRSLELLHSEYGRTYLTSEYPSIQEAMTYYRLAHAYHRVGQDLDAADCCYLSASLESTHSKRIANDLLARLSSKLLQLKENICKNTNASDLVPEGSWFENYVNPIELLQIGKSDATKGVEVKEVQKAKKILLQEIDLEDGIISWMPNLKIDRSRAIKLVDELSNEKTQYYHQQVFQCKPLLDFLSRGRLDLFLYSEDEFITRTLTVLTEDRCFVDWISGPFSRQYDTLFAAALSQGNAHVIEALLSGRRLVAPDYEDKCFAISARYSEDLLDELKAVLDKVEQTKPTIETIKRTWTKKNLNHILEVLPHPFREIQSAAAQMIRSISVRLYNHHGDADLAREVLGLAENCARRLPSVRVQLEQDVAKLNQLIAEERKYESKLILGNKPFEITREGVVYGNKTINAIDVETLRWGVSVQNDTNYKTYEFEMVVGGKGSDIIDVSWRSSSDIKKQNELFEECVNAIIAYILSGVMQRIQNEINAGRTVYIGGVPIVKNGITLKARGWFGTKNVFCSWRTLASTINNGSTIITSTMNPKATVSLPLADVDNAWILHMLIKEGMMK